MKKTQVVIMHLVFWFIVLSLSYSFLIFGSSGLPVERYLAVTVKSILEICDFYIFYLLIIPHFFIRKRYFRFFAITILYALVYIGVYAILLTYTYILLKLTPNWHVLSSQFLVATYYTILYIFLGGLFRLAIDGVQNHQHKIRLEQQNVKNELALLRAQINPHFLFNTLNTIHSYIISKNPDSAQAVIKLSDIMRYMLYDAGKEKITLEQELEYLKSYISLQDFRLEKEGFVRFTINGNPKGLQIPPMLFTPFVENAFKHGKKWDTQTGIVMQMDIEKRFLHFEISNFFDSARNPDITKSEGVGLKNVRRRLELLYPGKHNLEIIKEDSTFIVRLRIELE